MKKQLLAGVAAAGIIGGGVYGFAATLGVTTDNLGAGSQVVASCDTSVDVDYTSEWNASNSRYQVNEVIVSGIAAACDTDDIKVTLVDTANVQLGEEISASVASPSMTFDFSSDNVSAQAVTGVHVVISGE